MKRWKGFKRGGGRPKRYEAQTGELCAGVTTIIKGAMPQDALIGWANKVGRQGLTTHAASVEARDTGSAGHARTESYLSGEPYVADPKHKHADEAMAMDHLACFRKWFDNLDCTLVGMEQPYVSSEFLFGGTMDLLLLIDGELWIADLKTGGGPYPDWPCQLAAYKVLVEEQPHQQFPVAGGIIINTGEKKKRTVDGVKSNITVVRDKPAVWTWTADELAKPRRWFLNATENHHLMTRHIEPLIEEKEKAQ